MGHGGTDATHMHGEVGLGEAAVLRGTLQRHADFRGFAEGLNGDARHRADHRIVSRCRLCGRRRGHLRRSLEGRGGIRKRRHLRIDMMGFAHRLQAQFWLT